MTGDILPDADHDTHAGIHGYSSEDLAVAAELALTIQDTVYPAVL